MMQDPIGAGLVVRTKTRHEEAFAKHVQEHDERDKKFARRSQDAQEPSQNQPSSSSSSSSGTNIEKTAICITGGKAVTEKQDPMDEKSNVTVSRNGQTQYDDDRYSKRPRLSSVATHHSKPQRAEVLKYWDRSMVAN